MSQRSFAWKCKLNISKSRFFSKVPLLREYRRVFSQLNLVVTSLESKKKGNKLIWKMFAEQSWINLVMSLPGIYSQQRLPQLLDEYTVNIFPSHNFTHIYEKSTMNWKNHLDAVHLDGVWEILMSHS